MDLSRVDLIGRVQPADAETRFTGDGRQVVQFRFVVSRGKKVNGAWENESDWYRISCFGALAERIADKATKGARLYVSGRLVHRPWTDNQGRERLSIEVMANDVIALDQTARTAGEAAVQQGGGNDFDDMPF